MTFSLNTKTKNAGILSLVAAVLIGAGGPALTCADPIIYATKDDTLTVDIDGDGAAEPGDTLTYEITVTNNGNMDATGVTFTDTIDGRTTLVPGSITTTPLAIGDIYDAIGNVQVVVAAPGVLANDVDPDGGPITAVAISGGASANGGDVDLAVDGGLTYDPPPGFEGLDSFSYTLEDADGNTDSATVTISVSGMIWFVDGSGANGDGRLSSPFNCLVGTGCFDPAAADEAGDNVFVYEGSYNGGLTLLNSQKLIGDGSSSDLATVTGVSLPPESTPLPAFIGTKPAVSGSADGIRLGQSNTIRGLDIGSGTGTGIRGTGVGTLTISETSISGGGGIDISTGTMAVSLDALSASSSTDEGIRLTGVTGTFNIVDAAGTISTVSVPAVDITGTGGGISLGVTFASVSSTSSSTNGINLDTTTGSFTVTGTGPAGSGGTIANISGGSNGTSAGIGVRLNNVTNVSLSSMQLNDFSNFAIRGTNVTNFDLTDTTIDGSNGNSAAFDEGSVSFTNLLGNATFMDNTISGGLECNLGVVNASGTLDRMTVLGGTIGLNSTALGNDGVFAEAQGSATLNLTVEDVLFLGARGDLLQTNTLGNSTMDIVILDNIFENSHPNIVSGGGGITLSGGSASSDITVTYDVSGTTFGAQTFRDALGNAITINYLNGAGTAFGTVENNRIGVSGVVGSGSDGQSGMSIGSGGSVNHRVVVNNNEVLSIDGFAGLDCVANAQSTLDATITNNTIREMSGFVLSGMYFLAGGGLGDTSTLCSDIRNNTIDASGVSFASSVFFDQISTFAHHNLPSYAGAPHGEFGSPSTGTASVDIESYLVGRGNSLTAGGSAFFAVDASLVQGVTGYAGCALPLMAALGEWPGGSDVELLANEQLSTTVSRAIDVWSASGLSPAELNRLRRTTFEITDLPGGHLGSTSPMRVSIDHNGAGYGWFVASAFEGDMAVLQFPGSTELAGVESSEVYDKMDLLTVVIHELGHILGKPHADQPDLMADTLPTGVSRRPAAPQVNLPTDRVRARSAIHTEKCAVARTPELPAPMPRTAAGAVASSIMAAVLNATAGAGGTSAGASGEAVSLSIGTLPPGKSITITFEVTVDNPLPPGTTEVCNQGVVSGDNFAAELTDDPDVGGMADPTCTSIEIHGACCVESACFAASEIDCSGLGGVYQGDDTSCQPSPCFCGDLDGDDDVDDMDFQMFVAAFGRSLGDGSGLFNPDADFDHDNMITSVDYEAWLECFRSFGGDPTRDPVLVMPGDFDADSDIDLWDYAYFWDCMMDPEATPALPCSLHFDTDDDGVISLRDFADFQRSMTAPTK